jgi:hypothetical protein
MKNILLLVLAACSLASFAQLQQANSIKTVHGRGRNADYRTAVYEALVQAMSQVQGVSLQDSRDAAMDSLKQLKSTKQGDDNIDELRESLKQNVSAKTKGRVLSYEITSEKHDEAMGLWYIELDAKVPGQYTVGLPADNRRRMVVMPFRSLTDKVNVFGQTFQLGPACETIAAALNENLTQTRRFTMLDRAFNAETQAELSRLNLENASAGDFGRFQQLLVTDYMVIGTVKMYSSPSSSYNQWTGVTTQNDGPFIEVSYRVILVPTSQLKWAGTVIVPYSSCRGDSVDTAIASGMSVVAQEVCHDIVNNIYPMRVTAKTTFELVLNQGGKNVRAGEVFDVFRQGEAIIDVTSGETLGAPEEKIATIQVTRVDPKMSYAVVAEGTPLDQIPVGSVVRRPKGMPGAGGPPVGATSPVQVSPGGTVTPPWKR